MVDGDKLELAGLPAASTTTEADAVGSMERFAALPVTARLTAGMLVAVSGMPTCAWNNRWAEPASTAPRSHADVPLPFAQPKVKGTEELPAYTAYFFTDDFAFDAKVREKVMAKGDPKARLRELAEVIRTADLSSDTAIEQAMKSLAEKNALGFGDYQAVARLALSGTNVGPSITGMIRVMGRERVLRRIERFLAA